jgi:hypothetical protein
METLNKRDILKIKPGDTCPIYFFNETMFSGSLLYTEVAIKRKLYKFARFSRFFTESRISVHNFRYPLFAH